MTPFEEILAAVRDYGDAAMENFVRCRAFGLAVFNGLPKYLECPATHVRLVPSQGPFDPTKDYGEKAFSFSADEVIRLEPIAFGICLIIPNTDDSGSLWLRTGVRVEITGSTFDVFVSNQAMVRAPLDFTGKLEPIFDSIKREYLSVFRKELANFNDERYAGGIGFLPNPPANEVTTEKRDVKP